jgi:tripartite-type tricarboxylate transporter receptor subunit TctC
MNFRLVNACRREQEKFNGSAVVRDVLPFAFGLLLSSSTIFTIAASAEVRSKPYYQGKTIRIIVGTTSGSLYDQWAQVLARSMPKYISGQPNIIVQNMPGIVGIVAANYGYTVPAPDGKTVILIQRHVYLEQLTERQEAKFDLRRFHWIGSPDKSVPLLFIRADSPYKTVDDILKSANPPKCGASSRSDLTYSMSKVMEIALGGTVNLVVGYSDGSRVNAGIESGEVVCRLTSLDVHLAREPFQTWDKKGFDRHLLLFGPKRDPRIPDVGTIYELMEQKRTSELNRGVAEAILAGNQLGRPIVAPPGTPPEAVKILRTAYMNVFSDPDFLAQAKKLKIATDPSSGEDLQNLVRQIMDQPSDVIARLKILMANPPAF